MVPTTVGTGDPVGTEQMAGYKSEYATGQCGANPLTCSHNRRALQPDPLDMQPSHSQSQSGRGRPRSLHADLVNEDKTAPQAMPSLTVHEHNLLAELDGGAQLKL